MHMRPYAPLQPLAHIRSYFHAYLWLRACARPPANARIALAPAPARIMGTCVYICISEFTCLLVGACACERIRPPYARGSLSNPAFDGVRVRIYVKAVKADRLLFLTPICEGEYQTCLCLFSYARTHMHEDMWEYPCLRRVHVNICF